MARKEYDYISQFLDITTIDLNINQKNEDGFDALLLLLSTAPDNAILEIAPKLLNLGANPNRNNSNTPSPIEIANTKQLYGLIPLLLAFGADNSDVKLEVVSHAVLIGHTELVHVYLDYGILEKTNYYSYLVELADMNSQDGIVELLKSNNVSDEATSSAGGFVVYRLKNSL